MATKTLNIALDEKLLKKIDKAVKKDMGSRSEYFRRLAMDDLERRQRWGVIMEEGKKVGKAMGITSEQEVYDIIAEYKEEKRAKREKSQKQKTKISS